MTRIDARGLRCPWPAIRLARALRDGVPLPIHLISDDPAAPGEVRATAERAGLTVQALENGLFVIARAP